MSQEFFLSYGSAMISTSASVPQGSLSFLVLSPHSMDCLQNVKRTHTYPRVKCPKDSVRRNLWGWTARCPFASSVSLSQYIGIPLRAGDDASASMTIRQRRSKILGDVIELESASTLHDPDQEDVQEKICKEQDRWYKTQNTVRVCVYGYPTLTSSLFVFKSRIVLQGARHQQQSDTMLNYRTLYENHMKKIIETS